MDATEKEIYSSLLVALVIIGAILVYFIASIIRQQRRYQAMAQAKINAEITTLENERRRIASDLHDEVGPLLSAVKLQINHLDGASESERELIIRSSHYIDDIIKKMREISNDLLPNVLVRRGFSAAVHDFIGRLSHTGGVAIEFDSRYEERLPAELEVNLYRIVQEIIHNTIKHAKANRLSIRFERDDKILRLATADDGVGFQFESVKTGRSGLGLLNLQSRTDVMRGHFSYQSERGKGTRYLFEIPIPQTA